MGASTPPEFGVSQTMVLLLFGTNTLLCLLFQIIHRMPSGRFVGHGEILADTSEDEDDKKGQQPAVVAAAVKKMSEPFVGSTDCFVNLTSELFRTGCIMALTYICEKHWFHEHMGKTYDRDLFIFVVLLFFGYAFLTTKRTEDLTLLSPDQTLEWKGWMQFIFLLYHYFHAEEVYNSVRVMITCYVWMTGYGQFSSYYTKQDFGWLKVSHNLWRLNFAVLLLMWTHGNTYILYYICPMHTFYFLLVYVTMYAYSSLNHSKWGIRTKLLVVGIIIYLVWDVNRGLFDVLFAWLGTDSVVGATNGSVWEYYFRTSLDHWSSYLGMIFALNYPMADQFFNKAGAWPLLLTSVVMAALSAWWYLVLYSQQKMEYNLTHSYFAIIPLVAYIFFRNISPRVRRYISYSLVDLGKTTLETYLLQHHIWLSSNAKTLLNITPGYPWVNFFLASTLFVLASKELYRITTSLRAMMLPEERFPDGKSIAINNILGMLVCLGVCYIIALCLTAFAASMLETILACLGLFLVSILFISRFAKQVSSNPTYQMWVPRASWAAMGALVCGILLQLSLVGMYPDYFAAFRPGLPAPTFVPREPVCLAGISAGRWIAAKCPDAVAGRETRAFCETDSWVWSEAGATVPASTSPAATAKTTPAAVVVTTSAPAAMKGTSSSACPIGKISSTTAKTAFKGRRITFAGDSIMRNTYHMFNVLLDPTYAWNSSVSFRHGNLAHVHAKINSTVTFLWTPMVSNLTSALDAVAASSGQHDLLVCGAAAWDALYSRSLPAYTRDLAALAPKVQAVRGVTVWMQPTSIVDNRLTSLEKQQFINEKTMQTYRVGFAASPAASAFTVVLDPTGASKSREGATVDGVHYSEDIYRVIAQMCANAYTLHFPQLYRKGLAKKVGKPKATGSMSFPFYGAVVLAAAAIMLYTMDSFFGIAWAAMRVCAALGLGLGDGAGGDMTWEVAYREVHRKNNIAHPAGISSSSSSSLSREGSRGGSERGDSDRDSLLADTEAGDESPLEKTRGGTPSRGNA